MIRFLQCFAFSTIGCLALAAAEPPSPDEYLGRPIGADFQMADWGQVSGYYKQLAQDSPALQLRVAGQTAESRDFLAAVISSPENLDNLDAILAHGRLIADPRTATDEQRRRAIQDGKVVLYITPSMHADEPSSTEMAMRLSHQLATSDDEPFRSARQNAVVVLLPSLNPDGIDHVSSWYRDQLGTAYEGSSQPQLYQKYTGHDNNRDWFMLTQPEAQHSTRLMYKEFFPQLLWDVHEYGSGTRERFFVPPYRDPLNPNLDPAIVAGINSIGSRVVLDMTREGLSGIASRRFV